MSISSEITRISENISDSFTAVAEKGVIVPSGSTSDDLPGLIRAIQQSGGGGIVVTEEPDTNGGTVKVITAVDLSSDTVDAEHLLTGYTAHDRFGNAVSGSYVPSGSTSTQTKTATPTESQQTITPDTGYLLSSVTVEAISSNYIGSGVTQRSSTDLLASGATVTAPAGYYANAASKSINAGTAATPATTINITPSISVNTSTGVITATANASQYVTPTINAGYVSAGTSGKITVSGSNTSNLTTQAAATITPTKSSQTAVAANRYTTGAVTVAAIPAAYQDVTSVTATASDVLSGKTIVNSSGTQINGSLVIQHYYTGSSTPAAATGSDGDIYLKTS